MALTSNIVAYWKLDNTANDSVASFNGTLQGSPSYVTGKINQGIDLEFNSGQYVNIGADAAFSAAAYTIAGWINIESKNNDRVIFSKNNGTTDGYTFEVLSSGGGGQLNIIHQGVGNFAGSTAVGTATWIFVAVTYSGGTATIYVNGVSDGSGSLSAPTTSTQQQCIGSLSGAGDYFDGIIDEMGYWSRALTAGELLTLYNSGTGLQYPFTQTVSVSETSTETETYTYASTKVITLSETSTETESLTSTSPSTTWNKQAENSSSWSNQTKH